MTFVHSLLESILNFISGTTARRFLYLFAAYLSDKLFYFFVPYLLDAGRLYRFNGFYFLTGLLSSVSLIGLNYSFARKPINKNILLTILITNSFISGGVVAFVFSMDYFPLVLPAVISANIIMIYQFYYLLNENPRKYFWAALFANISMLAALLTAIVFEFDIVYMYLLGLVIPASVMFIKLNPGETGRNIIESIGSGITVFIINSSTALVIVYSKFLFSRFSEVEANALLFAFFLVSPVFILGNLIERFIYLSLNDKRITYKISISVYSAAIVFYAFILFTVLNNFNNLLPASIDLSVMNRYLWILFIGMSLFSVIHYPLNGYLLRNSVGKAHNNISLAAGILFVGLMFFSTVFKNYFTPMVIIIVSSIYLLMIDSIKFFLSKKYFFINLK